MASSIQPPKECRRRTTLQRTSSYPSLTSHPSPSYKQIDHLSLPSHSQDPDLSSPKPDHAGSAWDQTTEYGPTRQKLRAFNKYATPVLLALQMLVIILQYRTFEDQRQHWFVGFLVYGALPCGFLVACAWKVRKEYLEFLSLGPGGTPSTFRGFCKVTWLSLFALPNPLDGGKVSHAEKMGKLTPKHGILTLPRRWGTRPYISGVAPQRQITQYPPHELYFRLRRSLISAALTDPAHRLETKTSCFEKQGLALFAKKKWRVNQTCKGEICHVHAIDGSLHLNLHPSDVRRLCEGGWGQRHPLAGRRVSWRHFCERWRLSWLGRVFGGAESEEGVKGKVVPETFCLVYAPRNEAELEVVGRIVEAASWWVMGEELFLPDLRASFMFFEGMTLEDVDASTEAIERVRKGEFGVGKWKEKDYADVMALMKEAGVKDTDRLPGMGMELTGDNFIKHRELIEKAVALRLLLAKIDNHNRLLNHKPEN